MQDSSQQGIEQIWGDMIRIYLYTRPKIPTLAIMTTWTQIRIHSTMEHCHEIEDCLIELGAGATTIQNLSGDPMLDMSVTHENQKKPVMVLGLFDQTEFTDSTPLLLHLSTQLPTSHYQHLDAQTLINQDWQRVCLDQFQPMQFADNLWVCPSNATPPNPNAVNILLDPGLAFGTGTHATTSMCLSWLAQQDLKGKTVVDYGCGSGILAIGALKLGAAQAICVDNDMQALTATRDNAERNQIDLQSIPSYLPDDMPSDVTADIVIANILAKPLIDLCPILVKMLKLNGMIGLSGILCSQANTIIDCYQAGGIAMSTPTETDDWCFISGQKHSDC